ncbi:MAG: hypothetical protein IJS60_06695 [Abditibacteriota bacterium]|nr:hypothetical protein [Abditibacteriota bacterium]
MDANKNTFIYTHELVKDITIILLKLRDYVIDNNNALVKNAAFESHVEHIAGEIYTLLFDYIAIPRDEFYILLDKLKSNKLTIEDLTQFDIITKDNNVVYNKPELN